MTTREAMRTLLRCHMVIARNLAGAFDRSLHRYPYPYLFGVIAVSVVTSIVNIGNARMERDSLNEKNWLLQQRLDTLEMAAEARAEMKGAGQ